MTQPLALIFYEKLLPGSQLANRLRDLGYRVQVVTETASLVLLAEQEKPLLVLADLGSDQTDVCAVITELKNHPATSHLPVLAFAEQKRAELQTRAHAAGATLVASDELILTQLPRLLEKVLEVE